MNRYMMGNLLRVLVKGVPRTREELIREQDRRLSAMVAHSVARVPYYRKLFKEAGLEAADIRTVKDLKNLPTTSKRRLQELPRSEIIAEGIDPDRLICRRTSGSSGEPFSVLTSWSEDRFLAFRRMRPLVEWGWRPWQQLARLKIPAHDTRPPSAVQLLRALGVLKIDPIDSLKSAEEIVAEIARLRPRVVTGYPAVLATIAPVFKQLCSEERCPDFLVAGGATMTELMRAQIEEAFRAPVKESYASHEFNLIASQCPFSDWLHVADDSLILEVLDGDRQVEPGETGDAAITGLFSFSQPFIRFRLDDRVERGPAPCPCGAPFSTLRQVVGRIQDWIVFKDGTLNSPDRVFSTLAGRCRWIRQFQMEQPNTEEVILSIVPDRPPTDKELRVVRQLLEEFTRDQISGRLNLTEHLPVDSNGKFRVSRSRVHPFYD